MSFPNEPIYFEHLLHYTDVIKKSCAKFFASEYMMSKFGHQMEEIGTLMHIAEVFKEVNSVYQCSLVYFNY